MAPRANLDWKFEDEVWSQSPRNSASAAGADAVHYPLSDSFRGPQSGPRVASAQRSLDAALDQWWSENETPSLPILRDGLLLLDAGYDLSGGQRSLLLRTAIVHQRGILTALGYQVDPELTGLLLAAAMLNPQSPLTDAQVRRLVREDDKSEAWLPYFREELVAIRADDGNRQQVELMRLQTHQALAELSGTPNPNEYPRVADVYATARPQQFLVRGLLVILAVALIVSLLFGQQLRARARDTISVPAGAHTVSDPNQTSTGDPAVGKQTIAMDGYHIDRHEVTVRDYRRCVAAGTCLWPSAPASATRPDYLNNRAFDLYPMINVDTAAATAYCTWAGMRLPTAAEWEVAAAYAPATQRYYLYPWGDRFEPRYANSAANEPHDTQPVSFYHPFGSSSLGAADMAGNVAEWTATTAPNAADSHLVKGGSYRDDPTALRTDVAQVLPAETVGDWLGFRCAMSKQ